MSELKEQSESLRYERKFLITDYSQLDVEQLLKFHPACFSEIFHQRTVNNIYFDNPGLMNYFDNIESSTVNIEDKLKAKVANSDKISGVESTDILKIKDKEMRQVESEASSNPSFSILIFFFILFSRSYPSSYGLARA